MLKFLDFLFEVFHISLIIFNLTGWMWSKTRVLNRITLGLTFLSWFGLGIFFGFGYCPSTDWHWQVKFKLGVKQLPNSYIKYLYDNIFETNASPIFIDTVTLIAFSFALGMAIFMWRREKK